MYFILIIGLLIILLISYALFKGEILCPPVLVTIMFFLCTVFGIFRYDDWYLGEYTIQAVVLILLGVFSFVIFGYLGYVTSLGKKNHKIDCNKLRIRRDRIEVSSCFIFFAIVVGCMAIVVFFIHIRSTLDSFNLEGGSFSSTLMGYYQLKTNHGDEVGISGIVRILAILSNMNAVFLLYVLLHNWIFKVFRKKDFFLLACVGLWIFHALLDSSRGAMMLILAETVFLIYFFWNMYYGWTPYVNRKILGWGIKAFCLLIVLFLILTVVMGRYDSLSSLDIRKYLTTYISAGIRNFDIFIQDTSGVNSDIWGKETFFSINRFLYNRFGIGEYYNNALDFTYIHGVRNGNIYCAFRRFYADFGLVGLVLLPGVMGYGFTHAYKSVRYKCMEGLLDFGIILFAYLSPELFLMPIEERFFTSEVSVNGIFRMFLLYLLYAMFIKRKVVLDKR